MNHCENIRTLLGDLGLANTAAWPVFVGYLPPTPGQCIALFPTAGEPPVTKVGLDKPGVQLTIRGAENDEHVGDYAGPANKAEEIYEALDGVGPQTVGGTDYREFFAESAPYFRERDENGRVVFTLSFTAWVSRPE